MQTFTNLTAPATYLPVANIDTDVIVPARYLKVLTRRGLAGAAFYSYRFDAEGGLLKEGPFHREDSSVAPIVIAGDNFGCGSSREHAAWALYEFGIRAIIAPAFGDIFAGNAFKNGLLLIQLCQDSIDRIVDAGIQRITIDLAAQTVRASEAVVLTFAIDPFRKQCLLTGLDEISLTQRLEPDIVAFEQARSHREPWIHPIHQDGTP